MTMIAAALRQNCSWLAGYFLGSIVFASMLTVSLPAFAQQTQPYHLISANSDNASSVKGAAGQVATFVALNTTATIYYLKFYDTASTPTCGTTPVKLTFPIPATASSNGGGFVIPLPQAVSFLQGIGMCLVGGINDSDDTSAATGVAVDVFFK